jgi:hypothetical protein
MPTWPRAGGDGVMLPIVSFTHGASRAMIRQTLEGLAGEDSYGVKPCMWPQGRP